MAVNPKRIDLIHRGIDSSFYHMPWTFGSNNFTSLFPTPFSSDWTNLGGTFLFDPVTVLWGPFLLYVFGIMFDSQIYYRSLNRLTNKWSGSWISLVPTPPPSTAASYSGEAGNTSAVPRHGRTKLKCRSNPAVTSLYPKTMEIVVQGADTELYHTYWQRGAPGSGWSPFRPLSGHKSNVKHFRSSPELISTPGSGVTVESRRFDVFATGLDGKVYHKWWVEGVGWLPHGRAGVWEDLSMGVLAMDTPRAVGWGKERMDLVGLGGGGVVRHISWNEQGWGKQWREVGMSCEPVGRPEVVSWGPGRLDIFVIGTDRAIHHKWLDELESNEWQPRYQTDSWGGQVAEEQVTAVTTGRDTLAIFHVGRSSGMHLRSWSIAPAGYGPGGSQWIPAEGYQTLPGSCLGRIVARAAEVPAYKP